MDTLELNASHISRLMASFQKMLGPFSVPYNGEQNYQLSPAKPLLPGGEGLVGLEKPHDTILPSYARVGVYVCLRVYVCAMVQ